MRYSRRDLCHKFDITPAQFARWRYKGLLPPAVIPVTGKADAYYTDEHADRIRAIIEHLIDGKVTIQDLRERFMYEDEPELLDDGDVFQP